MSISQIRPDKTLMDSRIIDQPKAVQGNVLNDFSQSSLVSLSTSQEEGFVSEIFSGAWSVISWPVMAVVALWNWISGVKVGEETELERDNPLTKIKDLFQRDDEFDSQEFKAIFASMSSSAQKAFKTILWVVGRFQIDAEGKDWATRLVNKKTFDEEDQELLKAAAEMQIALPKLSAYAARAETIAREMANEEDSEADIDEELVRLRNGSSRWPSSVNERAEQLFRIYEQRIDLPTSADRNENWQGIQELRALARVNQILAKNHFLAVSNASSRDELATMLRRLSQIEEITEGDIVNEYYRLGASAKAAFTEVVGYMIGRPAEGEKYLLGLLRVEDQVIVPDQLLLIVALKELVEFDGGFVPERLQKISYSPLSET
jgi:hypothetical protein